MKHIIITGASGLVATELILRLLDKTDAHLYLLSTHPDEVRTRYEKDAHRVECFTLDSFSTFASTQQRIFDFCIHTGFARAKQGELVAQSLDYLLRLLILLKGAGIKTFVNISSQSIYGSLSEPLWTEHTPPSPNYLYAMGKYASEVITQSALNPTNIQWTNIRLCSVCENARFIRIFVQNAINGTPIRLTAPHQQCSFIDVRDVADALLAFIGRAEGTNLEPAYNLGANLVHTVAEIAATVKEIGEKRYGLSNIAIMEEAPGTPARCGMNSSLFMKTFHWCPACSMDSMVTSLYEMLLNTGGGIIPGAFCSSTTYES